METHSETKGEVFRKTDPLPIGDIHASSRLHVFLILILRRASDELALKGMLAQNPNSAVQSFGQIELAPHLVRSKLAVVHQIALVVSGGAHAVARVNSRETCSRSSENKTWIRLSGGIACNRF